MRPSVELDVGRKVDGTREVDLANLPRHVVEQQMTAKVVVPGAGITIEPL